MKVAVASDKMNAFQPPTLPSLTDANDDGDFDDPEDSSNGGVSCYYHRITLSSLYEGVLLVVLEVPGRSR
jgi:hypothetical protein